MDFNFPIILHDKSSSSWLQFEHPWQIVTTANLPEVLPALRKIEQSVNRNGWHAAGFISYEAAPAFDNSLTVRPSEGFPLLWFGLFPEPRKIATLASTQEKYQVGEWQPSINRETYNAAIVGVKDQISRGKTYQVNYTFRLLNQFTGNPWAFFVDMVNTQTPGYAAFMDTGNHVLCSASPELFFRMDGDTITCQPMKGTTKRGLTLADDHAQADWLKSSIKNRAENIMIVDMIRNDLGRLAKIGSVRVPELFITERYPTLWQMTSRVTAEINSSFTDILTALFPCASITGAPKVSTMQIIAALETTPRRVYTGAIGYLAPGRQAQFSVGIRTMLLHKASGRAEYGIGGGIVWDSTTGDEYAEALLKARVLTSHRPEFSLLETLRWIPQEGYFLLEEHLKRLADSAAYFEYPYDCAKTSSYLENAALHFEPVPQRVRLLLDQSGNLSHQSFALQPGSDLPLRLKLAKHPIRSDDIFLYHKTTRRAVYEKARQDQPDCDDVILFNERGQVTETSIANLVIELDGNMFTPPVVCGLLAGTFRAHLLAQGTISEKIIALDDLRRCTNLFVINSVRGWQKAQLPNDLNQP